MNETLNDAGNRPDPGQDPRQVPPRPPHQDLDRLRRSTTDRYIAGVAGGLGRHFDIDPTIIRVLLVVLTFFGGAGLVIYAACWLFVPEDGAADAPVRVASEPRKILLLAAVAVALLLAVGDVFNGFDGGFVVAGVAAVVALVMIIRDRGQGSRTPVAPAPGAPTYGGPTYGGPTYGGPTPPPAHPGSEPTTVDPARQDWTAPERAAWQPPTVTRPPLIAPHRKRTGIVWFWPTLALVAVGLGTLGLYDHSHTVVDGAYPALALAIIAVMLLVGSVVGRPGGLIFLGLVAAVALAANVAVGGKFGIDAKEIHETPATAAAVADDYHTTVGDIRLDLTSVSDWESLAGREISVHLRTGSIEVIVPRGLNVDVDARMHLAGGIKVPGRDGGGFDHTTQKFLAAVPASSTAPLVLDLDAKLGQITVEHR